MVIGMIEGLEPVPAEVDEPLESEADVLENEGRGEGSDRTGG